MVGITVIADVVEPVFHKYVPPPVAVTVAFCPWQIILVPAMVVVGTGFTITVTDCIATGTGEHTLL